MVLCSGLLDASRSRHDQSDSFKKPLALKAVLGGVILGASTTRQPANPLLLCTVRGC